MHLKLISWNVNGIRAAHKKGFLDWFKRTDADIVCLQETKASPDQLPLELKNIDGHESYWNLGERKGYSGVATYTRQKPLTTQTNGFPYEILNLEGRIIENEYDKFFLFNVYFPNGGMGPERLKYKLDFYDAFLKYILSLKKPIIITGDVNTAHTEIDLARPKENRNTSGFMDIERAWLDKLFAHGFIDTFRMFNKEPGNYSWWDMKTGARARNVGWRIDYFIVSEKLKPHIKNAEIHPQTVGSDHCPVSLEIEI